MNREKHEGHEKTKEGRGKTESRNRRGGGVTPLLILFVKMGIIFW